jgi:hypothetical protein
VEVPVSKLVPLFEDGADDLEQKLLASARSDGPPDGAARAKTLAAIAAATPVIAAAGAGAHAAHAGSIITKWAAIALVGVSIAFGTRLVVDARDDAAHVASAPHPHPSSSSWLDPDFLPEATKARPSDVPRARGATALPPPAVRSEPSRPAGPPPVPPVIQDRGGSPASATVPSSDLPGNAEPVGGGGGAAHAAPAPVSAHVLHEETVALEAAREALAAGDTARALTRLDDHDARFPDGQLEQEGVLLRVRTLVAAHRVEDARRVVDDFSQKHPGTAYELLALRPLVEKK